MDIGLDLTWWIFVFTAIIDGVYGGMTRVFTHDSGTSNLVPLGTTPVHVRRITECARICSGTTSCIGFYHSDNQQSCDLNVGQNFTGFVADSTANYYTYSVSFESAPTSPTSTVTTSSSTTTTTQSSSTVHSFTAISPFTEVSSSNCPASYTPDIRILGSSGNYYTVKCVHQAENHTDAQTGCYGHGMTLFRPNNATKVNEVAAFLTACAAYDATSYWMDAQKHISEPGKPWMNSDGSNVPTSAWYSSLPGNQTGELCARLDGTRGYLLNDINCDHVDPTWGYISYDATSYWTDAQKHISEPGKPWINSDGSNVPTSAWYSSLPGNQTGELCARLDGTRGYLLNDINCDHVDPTWGYICE